MNNNPDPIIDRVLQGLRDTEAPAGMERRILHTLQNPASVQPQSSWRRLLPVWVVNPSRPAAAWFLAGGIAFAMIFAVALALRPAIRKGSHPAAHSPTQANANLASVGSLPPATPQAVVETEPPPRPAPAAHSIRKPNPRQASAIAPDASGPDADSIALSETRALSFPAPPMPLTEQEKLFLRIVQRGDPVELAMLNPEMRARQQATGDAEFQKFFEPTPPSKPGEKP
jgi:hypothetical protein